MKKGSKKYRNLIVNLLISLVVCLIINFSYLVTLLLDSRMQEQTPPPPTEQVQQNNHDHGRRDNRDMEEYLRRTQRQAERMVEDFINNMSDTSRMHLDSLYQSIDAIRQHWKVLDTEARIQDSLRVAIADTLGSKSTMSNFVREDQWREQFGGMHPAEYFRRQNNLMMAMDVLFYFAICFLMLTIATIDIDRKRFGFIKRVLCCLAIAVVAYFTAPQMTWGGRIIIQLQSFSLMNAMLLLKLSIVLAIAIFYSKVYDLINQKQKMEMENEMLKSENLLSQYNVLLTQVNPHVFFNSLNSLSMLIREEKNSSALTYIDRMSDTFRYILQNGQTGMTTLGDELDYIEAYKYLFEIRYAGKFFVDIDVDESLRTRRIPTLSLQPLIENAVKHNTITSSRPLHVKISVEGNSVVVSNKIAPKVEQDGTGIGLSNLDSRHRLLTGKGITILNDGETFTVKLPLSK